jgi:RNA polymerase sigma factor (sigma-70 family)
MDDPRPTGVFPATRHSVFDALRSGDDEGRRAAFSVLALSYWRPVREYLCLRRKLSVEDAEDITQSFFARALTGQLFERFDPPQARFRTYLRVCVDRFASNEARRERHAARSATEIAAEELDDQQALSDGHSADDQLLRDAWVRWFFERVTARLEQELTASGKGTHFLLFRAYDLDRVADRTPPTYAALATQFGLPATQVTNFLALARREFRRLVLGELSATAASDRDFREELQELLGGSP